MQDSHYVHGTTPPEQERLSRLNELLNHLSLQEMALASGQRVLDVGSGLGQLTRAMARQVGRGGFVVGVERSSDQLRGAQRLAGEAQESDLVEFRHGDAARLPLQDSEWGSFDVVHTRFLLEHVLDPSEVVRAMVRAVRPGGRVILEDDGHDILRLWPEPPGFRHLWQTYMRVYDRVGNDPVVGHRLVSLLHQAGATPVRNTWLFFGACAGEAELLAAYVENLIGILNGVREPILGFGDFDATAFDQCLSALQVWGRRPDAAFWYGVSWAEGRRHSA